MKKLIIFVLTLFLTFTIFLSSKSVNAELVPITPIYEGDILNGKELYLFQDYTSTPNFENGYISKKTISFQDVYYSENNNFNGWYKNLGQTLIDDYTEPEHEPEVPYFTFYIVFNDMLGQYLQLGLISQEPYVSTYHIKYKNENATVLMETNQYNEYLIFPPTGTQTKEIEWLSYDVYYPDYLASFKPLTADITYNFGFASGEREGYNNGYNTGYTNGYNTGYNNGYSEGSIDTQYGVNTVVAFNQLVKNGNFEDGSYWNLQNITTFYNNTAIITTNSTELLTFQQETSTTLGHKYLITFEIKTNTIPSNIRELRVRYPFVSDYYEINTEYRKISIIATSTSSSYIGIQFRLSSATQTSIYIKNFMLFDLTQIYGQGNEPTETTQFFNDFPSEYYNTITNLLVNIDYQNGYIKGQKLGYNLGYDDGKDEQATKQLTASGWISSIFGGISSLLNIQIFPGVTIGIIVGIPFVISLAYFVIRAFRGGGGA